jgi:sugar lactone lactonase YvrE
MFSMALPVAASAQFPVLVPAGAREVLHGNPSDTTTDNYPPYLGTGSNGANGFFQGTVVRDAAGDIFFLDNDGSSKAANAQVIELPVTGPVQVVVPAGDSAFNCPGAPATLNTGGFELGADPAGNLYLGHGYGCDIITKISRITTAGSSYGTYCTSSNTTCTAVEASVFTALLNTTTGFYYQPYDIAVDALGNAYVASSAGLLMAGPSAPGGFNLLAASTKIYGVSVDSSGNVFYADTAVATVGVYEIPYTQVTNSVPVATKIGYYGTGTCPGCTAIASPASVFLDALGNVYVAGSGSTPNLWVIPNSSSGYGLTTYIAPATLSYHYASGTKGAIDNEGNFYFYNGTSIERYSGGSISIASSTNFFSGIFAASPSFAQTLTYQSNSSTNPSIAFTATQTVTFNATTPAQIVNAGSLNGGAAATSFGINTNTCTGTIAAGSTCYLYLTYAVTQPGTVRGALVLYGAIGTTAGNKVLSVVSLEALGSGAAVAVDPGVRTTVGTGYQAPAGIAVDGVGNMYVADPDSNAVYKYAPGSTTTGTSIGTGLSAPNAVAVDSAGDVYIADSGNDRVVVVPNELTGLNSADQAVVTTTGYGLSSPRGIALDSLGNLYIADTGNARVLVVPTPLSGSVYGGVPFALSFSANGNPSGYAFSAPYGIAVDAFQNIYVADAGANAVWLFPSGSGFTGSTTVNAGPGAVVKLTNSAGTTTFSAPTGVAVDAAGSVYVADSGHAKIVRLPATVGTYSTTPPTASTAGVDMFTGLSKPFGIATDQTADLYYTDQNAPMVAFVQRSVANGGSGVTALAFGSSTVGNTTSAQSVTLSNAGLITALSATSLPTLTSGSSPFAETATTCSTSSSLAVGSSCAFSLTFDPTATGPVTSGAGTFSFTDNALGGTGVTQGYQLTGIGVGTVSTLTLTGPTAITYGDTATYTVTAKDSSGNVVTLATGAPYSLSGSFSATGTLNAGGTFYLPNLLVTGSPYTFTVTVNSVTSSGATVSVAKAPLYITSANVSRLFDVANPTFATPTYSGFVSSDTSSTVVSTTASSSTTANRISPIGNYLIMPAGGTLTTFGGNNYTPTYVSGNLVITGSVPQTIFFAPLPAFTHGATTYTLSGYSSSGLPLVYGVTSGSATISGNTLTVTAAGAVTVTAYQFGNSTYAAATSVSRSFTAQ